jgi:two-component system, chemotaxis family, CheB/CheR fusion protein
MPSEPEIPVTELSAEEAAAFNGLLETLKVEHGVDLRDYKSGSLVRRVRARMTQVRARDFDAYKRLVISDDHEAAMLLNTVLINVTAFFRDPEAWEALSRDVVPELVRRAAVSGSVRIWSAGCSTGEEAFSLVMLLAEQAPELLQKDVKVYATDIDDDALATARQGFYRLEQLKDLPNGYIDRYFSREGHLYRFRRELRRLCIFGRHNLVDDPPLARMDLLVCRNVLIYFKTVLQERLLPRFYYAIRDEGFLFLGKSETLLARSPWVVPLDPKWRIFQRTRSALPSVHAPMPDQVPAHHRTPPTAVVPDIDLAAVIHALPTATVLIDADDTVRVWNAAAEALYGIRREHAVGHHFRDLDISYRAEGLRARIEDVQRGAPSLRIEAVTFTARGGRTVHIDVTLEALFDAEHRRLIGILVAAVDVTSLMQLKADMRRVSEQHAVGNEELHSANEELETTNEELQSTNEELETTNEELQSTNQELETTNEELQSTNTELLTAVEELQTANAQLGIRSEESNRLALYHASVVASVREAVVVLDGDLRVTSWNPPAERLWGIRASDAIGKIFTDLRVAPLMQAVQGALSTAPEPGKAIEVAYHGPMGDAHVLRVTALVDEGGAVHGVVATASAVDKGVNEEA